MSPSIPGSTGIFEVAEAGIRVVDVGGELKGYFVFLITGVI